MKNQCSFPLALAILAISTMVAGAAEQTDTNRLNRFAFSARLGFNVTAKFKNLGRLSLTPTARTTPNGDAYNYDDGYVLTDVSGNFGNQTWYWGYDNQSQISGNTILMNRTTPSANVSSAGGKTDEDPNLGGELSYNRELGRRGKLRYGVEAAGNFMTVGLNDRHTLHGNLTRTTDAYPFTPGTTPPLTPPSYQGSFDGPGFVIGATPVSSTTTLVPGGATITGQRKFDADIWGFRLGPYLEYPLTERLHLSLSGGLAAALVNGSASWAETISVTSGSSATSTGRGHASDLMWGGYVSGKLSWQLSPRWNVEGGVQFQDLGIYQRALGGRKVEMDLSKSVFVTIGVGYSF